MKRHFTRKKGYHRPGRDIAEDAENPDALWITEVWDSKESHAASLQLPQVQEMIAKARPLIAGMDSRVETKVVKGV